MSVVLDAERVLEAEREQMEQAQRAARDDLNARRAAFKSEKELALDDPTFVV
jgi:hypothetical protein